MILGRTMKRTPARDLVKVAMSNRKPDTWFDKLTREDRNYIEDVIEVMKLTGVSTFHSVSAALKNELHLLVGLSTIKDTLQEKYKCQGEIQKS